MTMKKTGNKTGTIIKFCYTTIRQASHTIDYHNALELF